MNGTRVEHNSPIGNGCVYGYRRIKWHFRRTFHFNYQIEHAAGRVTAKFQLRMVCLCNMVNEIMEIVFNDVALSESSGRGCFRLRINGRFGEASEDGA